MYVRDRESKRGDIAMHCMSVLSLVRESLAGLCYCVVIIKGLERWNQREREREREER